MYVLKSGDRLSQGDILENYEFESVAFEATKVLYKITFPYVVVMTQDCDLEWDFESRNNLQRANTDKFLQSILLCPAYLAEEFKVGKHLEKLNLSMSLWSGNLWGQVKNNNHERFHFLPEDPSFGTPNLIIDFKHYYTVFRDDIYDLINDKAKFSIEVLYREQLSQRFAYYLSRIGLPTLIPS